MLMSETKKLFKILIRHCSQKDKKEAIVGYFLAYSDEQIYNYIDKELMSGIWTDNNNDSNNNEYKNFLLSIRGQFNDPDADYSDGYYGITHYGWTEGKPISSNEEEVILRLGIAKNI